MSLCRPANSQPANSQLATGLQANSQLANASLSCVACCGILNLKLGKTEMHSLLQERTSSFQNNFPSAPHDYRIAQEKKERDIVRVDPEIYVCPFLGFSDNKAGCMLHPEKTGVKDSQNFSFYGAAICQNYECKNFNKEQELSALFLAVASDWIEFSMMAADYKFWEKIEAQFSIHTVADLQRNYKKIEKEYRERFSGNILPLTSFELY